jgi:hypothetical protein
MLSFFVSHGGFPLCHVIVDVFYSFMFTRLQKRSRDSIPNSSADPKRFSDFMVVDFLTNCFIDPSQLGERPSKAQMSEPTHNEDGS